MLLEYAVSNYRSFADEAFLDLHAPKNRIVRRFPNNFVVCSTGEKVLKDAVIVGENASGKSNFIESFASLRDLLARNDTRAKSYLNTLNSGNVIWSEDEHRSVDFDKTNSLQTFYVKIAFDGYTYTYELKIDRIGVVSEVLECQRSVKAAPKTVYAHTRSLREDCLNCEDAEDCKIAKQRAGCAWHELSYDVEDSLWTEEEVDKLFKNARFNGLDLALTWLAALGEKHCRRVFDWFVREVLVVQAPVPSALEEAIDREELLSVLSSPEYLDIVRLADRSIVKMRVDAENPFADSVLIREGSDGKQFGRAARDDSTGIQLFLCWAVLIYEVVNKNKTVLADEADAMINPVLSDRVIAFINGHSHNGQYIFTTHNIFNLTLRTYMKEQIYIITKDLRTLTSSMYSVADFDEIRYDVKEELYEFYLKGMLGGTPDE